MGSPKKSDGNMSPSAHLRLLQQKLYKQKLDSMVNQSLSSSKFAEKVEFVGMQHGLAFPQKRISNRTSINSSQKSVPLNGRKTKTVKIKNVIDKREASLDAIKIYDNSSRLGL